ncbi:hypothetical protein MXM33_13625 [Acinetobacter vivianii]|uniref:hypothetical protein n=1 Tax=Acinetobacter vivianii TaxID=1776742 RepID=UPI002DBA2F24|nr:hypothetical protein [Acinetobacter vivianii]MEB6668056.1 hypothetical protein [Acinetobacter vivianii]
MTAKPDIEKTNVKTTGTEKQEGKALTCGIIMPIATMSPEYPESHWTDIRYIIDTAIKRAGFTPRIVSDSEDSTIIHKSIINNIYTDPIIVCDVSNKNANVMFELGMRLAFNKPVVIIKDDKTGYSFDTSNIQHLGYRKDLRHNTVEKFIEDLAAKIKATHDAPKQEGYQSFLSHFGKFEVATIENKSIPESEALQKLLEKVTSLENKISNINLVSTASQNKSINAFKMIVSKTPEEASNIFNMIFKEVGDFIKSMYFSDDLNILYVELNEDLSEFRKENVKNKIQKILNSLDLPF